MIPLLLLAMVPQHLPGDRAVRQYLASRAAELERDFLPEVKSAADWERVKPEMRREYLYMLGLWPLPEKTPLHPVITGRLEHPDFTVEKLHFQSRPGLYVTANLYLPKPSQGRHPAILYSCGHYGQGRNGNKTAAPCQSNGIWFATHGYVCLVYDSLQLGEIAAIHHGTYRYERWWWHSLGYTSAGVECWNAIRGLDYLQSRPEVDPERIGATGISGGGAATFWISAADDRVKVSVPLSGMADLGYYVGQDGVDGHCDCMFFYNRARWNWTNIAGMVCPRPLLFANSDKDGIFPMSANERVINRLEHLYARLGVGDRVEAAVSIGGHAYRTDLRRAIYEFFNRHLKGEARGVQDPDDGLAPDGKNRIPFQDLRAFPEDKDIPADQINTKIDDCFVETARPDLPTAGGFDPWRGGLLERLRRASFDAWPAKSPDFQVARLDNRIQAGAEPTEEGILAHWRWLPGKDLNTRWLLVLGPGDDSSRLPEWVRESVGNGSALLLSPRGSDPWAWTRRNPPNTVERSMALLGTTVDAGRVWDILAVVRRRTGDRARWRAAGRGQAGILAAYAALYEPAIEEVLLAEPPPSHRPLREGGPYGPAFLNVLRVLDIPDALGCLAPRRLTLLGATDAAFERTAELYRLAGASERFARK